MTPDPLPDLGLSAGSGRCVGHTRSLPDDIRARHGDGRGSKSGEKKQDREESHGCGLTLALR